MCIRDSDNEQLIVAAAPTGRGRSAPLARVAQHGAGLQACPQVLPGDPAHMAALGDQHEKRAAA